LIALEKTRNLADIKIIKDEFLNLKKMKKKVIFLVGPTACGKSEIAAKLAQRINAEIISCDSMQVYKGMPILSNHPPKDLQKKVTHHLVGHVLPTQNYDVAKFRREAVSKIRQITKKDKIPILVGGTGFYFKVILDGIFSFPYRNKSIRERLYQKAKESGNEALYKELQEVDPLCAQKIHPNDLKRVIRALEVYRLSGIPLSVWQKKAKGIIDDYEVKIFGLLRTKSELYKRIKQRIEQMFKAGIVNEVKSLLRLQLSDTAKQALGIKEIADYLEGKYSLTDAKRMLILNTKRLVKKQMVWFKKDQRIKWIKIKSRQKDEEVVKEILKKI